MLPDEPLLRPLENPPPDPPRAFAKEIVGTPTRDNTRHAAINLVVFKRYVLSIERQNQSGMIGYPNSNAERKPTFPLRRQAHRITTGFLVRWPLALSGSVVAGNRPDLALKGVVVKQGYRLIVVDKDGVLVSEFQLTEQALAAPEAFVAALRESVEAIEEAEP